MNEQNSYKEPNNKRITENNKKFKKFESNEQNN